MPDHRTHCEQSYRKYGKKFSELHAWMDAPVKGLGVRHRLYRHDLKRTPSEAKELFGKFADHACIDHILLDMEKGDLPSTSSGVLLSRKNEKINI
jgi:hypothetical protein